MAIQLNERDGLIFSLIKEHKVLLEKHIAWFISSDTKPVLIRDRLRKLFYLDYLLCQRHPDTLPWWTTPTKPLVYTLSPMTSEIVGANDVEVDLNDANLQRHLLELANLRMLFLVAQKEGQLSDLQWTTCYLQKDKSQNVDALVSFTRNGKNHFVGILNHPTYDTQALTEKIHGALAEDRIDTIMLVSRDASHQSNFQSIIGNNPSIRLRLAYATHQELYKSGIVKSSWENSDSNKSAIFLDSIQETKGWSTGFVRTQAAIA